MNGSEIRSKGAFCREKRGRFHNEKYYCPNGSNPISLDFLDIRTFGETEFLPGGVFKMQCPLWVIQLQLSGEAQIQNGDELHKLLPGDLVLAPPQVNYSYIVQGASPMTKYFITLQQGVYIDIVLRDILNHEGVFILRGCIALETQFRKIKEALLQHDICECSTAIYSLLFRICEIRSRTSRQNNFKMKLQRAVSKIKNMTTLETLAAETNMKKYTLIRKFRKELDTTPMKYIISMRLEYASKMLMFSEMNITQIANACGYNSPAFFIKEFKKKYGVTPGNFRKNTTP
ncbi:MAG: AraC family transcriptional regulator [Victivallales bacterium]|nr:AraC family transcriptional regulator [Victivallales bacterium]